MYKSKNTGIRMAHSGIIQSDETSYSYVFVANQCLVTVWQEGRIVLRTPVKL